MKRNNLMSEGQFFLIFILMSFVMISSRIALADPPQGKTQSPSEIDILFAEINSMEDNKLKQTMLEELKADKSIIRDVLKENGSASQTHFLKEEIGQKEGDLQKQYTELTRTPTNSENKHLFLEESDWNQSDPSGPAFNIPNEESLQDSHLHSLLERFEDMEQRNAFEEILAEIDHVGDMDMEDLDGMIDRMIKEQEAMEGRIEGWENMKEQEMFEEMRMHMNISKDRIDNEKEGRCACCLK